MTIQRSKGGNLLETRLEIFMELGLPGKFFAWVFQFVVRALLQT